MAKNTPHNNGNYRGKKWWDAFWSASGKTGMESAGLGIAEVVSASVSLGVFATIEQVAPTMHREATNAIAKIIAPGIDNIEWLTSKVCKLEDCQADPTQNRDERARKYARLGLLFTEAFAASMVAKIGVRCGINSLMKFEHRTQAKSGSWFKDNLLPKKHDWHIILADEGVHLGAILMMNTLGAHHTDKLVQTTANILEKRGFSKDKAHEIASMGVIWELPNALGWLAGVATIGKDHFKREFAPLNSPQK